MVDRTSSTVIIDYYVNTLNLPHAFEQLLFLLIIWTGGRYLEVVDRTGSNVYNWIIKQKTKKYWTHTLKRRWYLFRILRSHVTTVFVCLFMCCSHAQSPLFTPLYIIDKYGTVIKYAHGQVSFQLYTHVHPSPLVVHAFADVWRRCRDGDGGRSMQSLSLRLATCCFASVPEVLLFA